MAREEIISCMSATFTPKQIKVLDEEFDIEHEFIALEEEKVVFQLKGNLYKDYFIDSVRSKLKAAGFYGITKDFGFYDRTIDDQVQKVRSYVDHISLYFKRIS